MIEFLRELILRNRMRMFWMIEKDDKRSYLLAAAHFYPRPYKSFLRGFIPKVGKVVFEGNVERVEKLDILAKGETLDDLLDESTILKIKNKVGITLATDFARVNTGELIYSQARRFEPWAGFLSIWLHYLEKKGWRHSVEVDALGIARELGKPVHILETLEEQIDALRKMPTEKIRTFLEKVDEWDRLLGKFEEMYEKGNLGETLHATEDFPTRCEEIIDKRDARLYGRMKAFLEEGNSLFLIGMAHCQGILEKMVEAGFKVKQYDDR